MGRREMRDALESTYRRVTAGKPDLAGPPRKGDRFTFISRAATTMNPGFVARTIKRSVRARFRAHAAAGRRAGMAAAARAEAINAAVTETEVGAQ